MPFLSTSALAWRNCISRDHEPFLEQMVPSAARYVISPEGMAHRIFATVLEIVQSGLVNAANYQIMPTFMEGETLGPGLARPRVSEARGAEPTSPPARA